MNLTPGTTINSGDTVTRQTLYDLWANAALGTIVTGDLAPGTLPITVASTPTDTPPPGQVWYDQTQKLWKTWFDEIDYTGCSLWLAWGPDRFDDAFIAAEPMPHGAAFVLDRAMGGRYVRRATWTDPGVIGFVQTPNTSPSGSWLVGGILGICDAWFPHKPASAGSQETALSGGPKTGIPNCVTMWEPGGIAQFYQQSIRQAYRPVLGLGVTFLTPVTTASNGNLIAPIFHTGVRQGFGG